MTVNLRLSRQAASPSLRDRIMKRIPLDRIVERIPLEQIKDRIPFQMKQPTPSRLRRAAPLIGAGAAGAVLAFVFDPDRGRSRRAKAKDMIAGRARRTARVTGKKTRYVAGKMRGMRHRMATGIDEKDLELPPDDRTLVDKIKSQAIGLNWDQSRIVINSVSGIVELRGEVDTPEDMERLEKAVRQVPGVIGVENMLHIKGSAAVNKLRARDA
jgi:hypothetical protein